MKKMIPYSGLLLAGAILFSGCGNAIPEMDEEARSMVVSYAADIVQKYDSNHPAKLQTLTLTSEEAEPELEEASLEDAVNESEKPEETSENQTPDTERGTDSQDGAEQQIEVTDNTLENSEVTLDSFLQFNAFNFLYEGYEVDDSYPTSGTEAYFAMSATAGNKLLVLKFMANNQSQAEETLDMLQTGIRFKVQVNGESKNALVTMLLNDFANYQGVIAAGESVELVVVSEIPEEEAGRIESLALILKNVDETATILLH